MKASDLLVRALENEGVKYIFALPGEENLDLLQSLKKSTIKFILVRHEQGAGFMAATYGRLTGEPGVCLSTLGPGAINLMTPAAHAQLGGMPMVMITGQKPIKKTKQGRFQIIDVVNMMESVTKYTRQIVNGDNIPSLVREAFRRAIEEKPGAVHLELPEDIADEECDSEVFEVVGHRMPNADDTVIAEAAQLIRQSKLPLLMVGAGANRKITSQALKKFIEITGIYFFTTQMGKGVIDERSPQYLGTAALSKNDFLHVAIDSSDLIINVGHDIVEKPPFLMEKGGKKVIHINFSPAQVDPVYFPQVNVVGDIANAINALAEVVENQRDWDFEFFERVKRKIDEHVDTYVHDTRFPMLPQRLIQILRQRLNSDDIVALDNGIYKIWFARNYKCHQPNTLILDNALATMGAGLPSAMSVNLLYPDQKVVAVCGDGGFMMNSQELETAVRLGLHITIIILNDGGYGMIKWKQTDMGLEDFGLDYNNPDFVRYAESYGANGHRPANDIEFQKVLDICLTTKAVHVIDLGIDYSLNHTILNVLLKEQANTVS